MMTLSNKFVADTVLSQTTSGLAGEYIAAASVLARGWRVAMAQQDAVDLSSVASRYRQYDAGTSQGLSGFSTREMGIATVSIFRQGLGGKKRLPTIADFDILAMVSTEQRVVWYLPVTSVNLKKYQRPISFFETPNLESDSWASAVEIINETNPKSQAVHNNKRGSRNGSNR